MSDPHLNGPANRILLVLGQTPFPVELLDSRGRVLYINVAYARQFLEGASTVLDRPSPVFPVTFASGLPRAEVLAQADRDGLWKGEAVVTYGGGLTRPVRIQVFPIRHPNDHGQEYAVYYEDISAELSVREALVRQQNLVAIRSRQAQMGELLSMIAHQWRQPLTVVSTLIGNVQLKNQRGALDPAYLEQKLERMAQTVQFLSETIDSFRNFYMPSKARTAEDGGALTRRAVDLLGPSIEATGIHLSVEAPPTGPQLRLFAGEFLQVVLELLTNARDALATAPEAGRQLVLRWGDEADRSILSVANNGPPIPPDVMPHIYDPYYTTKEGGNGTGLGLYMARLIVESHHGGTLAAESTGGWTTFFCSLPKGTPA